MNELFIKQNINSNIYLSEINLLGILYDQNNNINIVKIINGDNNPILKTEFNKGNRKDIGDIHECSYVDFNNVGEIKHFNSITQKNHKMYILTTETVSQLENKISEDLFLLLNRFQPIQSTGSPIVGSPIKFTAGKSKKNTKKKNIKKHKKTKK